jgi:hypothetical protein
VLNPQVLAVGETTVFNIKKLRDEQIPDRNGYLIPRLATGGQLRWSVRSGDGTEQLIGRSEVVSLSRKVSSTYSCELCCPYSFDLLVAGPFSFGLVPGQSLTILINGLYRDCFGGNYGPFSGCGDEVASDDPSVLSASLTANGNVTATGVAGGATQIIAQHTDLVWFFDSGFDDCNNYLANFLAGCQGQVPKKGACCLDASKGMCEQATKADCTAMGGFYHGDDTTCGAGIEWQCCPNETIKAMNKECITPGTGISVCQIFSIVSDPNKGGWVDTDGPELKCLYPDNSVCVYYVLWTERYCGTTN